MTQKNRDWFVYMLECYNGKIYTGITTNMEDRFKKHSEGKGAKFTQRNKPSHILAFTVCDNRSQASKLEWEVKQLTAQQKRCLGLHWNAQHC
jgi:putative endonuclease